jgi:4-amino-4-deoxy-L-arabinose transferase-like glycosyltransferase
MYISIFPHTIGYPAVLSIFYRIFGVKVIVAQLLNIVLSYGIAILIYSLGSKLHSRKCGFISTVIWSLWPSQIFYVSLVSSESLFVFLNLLCILFFINIAESRHNMKISLMLFALLGTLCAFANSIRPMALITLLALCIYFIVYIDGPACIPHKQLKKFSILIIVLISYYATSHTIQTAISNTIDRPLPSKSFGYSFFVGTNYDADGIWNQDDANILGTLMNNPNMTPQMIHDILSKMAVSRLKERSTFQTLKLMSNKFNTMWAADSDFVVYMEHAIDRENPSVLDFFKYERLLIITANLYYHILLIIAGVGNLLLLFRRKSYYSIVCIIIIGYIIAHFFLEAAGRYHYPVISLISLLSGYGLVCFNQLLNIGKKTEVYTSIT